VKWRKGRGAGNQSCEQACDIRCSEAAASDFLYRTGEPCNDYVLAGRDEFDEVAGSVEKFIVARREFPRAAGFRTAREGARPTKIHRYDRRKMSRPFAFHEVLVVAGGDDVASAKIRFIYPILVVEHMIFATTTEAAVENVVSAFEREPYAFANDERARAELLPKHTEAANLRFGRDSPYDSGDGCAVAEDVFAFTFNGCQA